MNPNFSVYYTSYCVSFLEHILDLKYTWDVEIVNLNSARISYNSNLFPEYVFISNPISFAENRLKKHFAAAAMIFLISNRIILDTAAKTKKKNDYDALYDLS